MGVALLCCSNSSFFLSMTSLFFYVLNSSRALKLVKSFTFITIYYTFITDFLTLFTYEDLWEGLIEAFYSIFDCLSPSNFLPGPFGIFGIFYLLIADSGDIFSSNLFWLPTVPLTSSRVSWSQAYALPSWKSSRASNSILVENEIDYFNH